MGVELALAGAGEAFPEDLVAGLLLGQHAHDIGSICSRNQLRCCCRCLVSEYSRRI